jgi:hypothetical protein
MLWHQSISDLHHQVIESENWKKQRHKELEEHAVHLVLAQGQCSSNILAQLECEDMSLAQKVRIAFGSLRKKAVANQGIC